MRMPTALALALIVAAAGCSSPTGPTGPWHVVTGTWVGSTSDSTRSMMGAGWPDLVLDQMTWDLTQAGTTFSGSMRFPGHQGGMGVSGTLTGHTGTFTMTIRSGMMMGPGCQATATGVFDMDEEMTELRGTFSGTNTCVGPFDHGRVLLTRR